MSLNARDAIVLDIALCPFELKVIFQKADKIKKQHFVFDPEKVKYDRRYRVSHKFVLTCFLLICSLI